MNILIPAGIFPPDIGGPANFVPRIGQWFSQRGHVVQVVCWCDEIIHDDTQYSFEVHRISRRGSRLTRLFQTVRILYKLGRSADVIFANGLDLEARIASTMLGKPELHKVVGDRAWEISRVRGWYSDTIDTYQSAGKPLRLRLLDCLRNFSLARASLVVAPSCYLAKIIEGWNIRSRPIQVIYNSTPLKVTTEKLNLPVFTGKTIVTVCRLVPWKGVDRLIEVLTDLPNCRLVIAGDGPDKSKLQQQAMHAGLENRVIFLGQRPKQQVSALFALADLFVLNSSYEGLPHVVLEAMAAHIPVIATDIGGTGEVVKHNETGLLIPFGDNQKLLASIRQVFDSAELRGRLILSARGLMETKFDEEACFQAYEHALVSMVNPSLKKILPEKVRTL